MKMTDEEAEEFVEKAMKHGHLVSVKGFCYGLELELGNKSAALTVTVENDCVNRKTCDVYDEYDFDYRICINCPNQNIKDITTYLLCVFPDDFTRDPSKVLHSEYYDGKFHGEHSNVIKKFKNMLEIVSKI